MSWLPFLIGHFSKNSIFCVTIRGCIWVIFRPQTGIALHMVPGWALRPISGRREFQPQLQVPRPLAFLAQSHGLRISMAQFPSLTPVVFSGRWGQSFSWFFPSQEADLESFLLRKIIHSDSGGIPFSPTSWFNLYFHSSFLTWLINTWLFVFCCSVIRHPKSLQKQKGLDLSVHLPCVSCGRTLGPSWDPVPMSLDAEWAELQASSGLAAKGPYPSLVQTE